MSNEVHVIDLEYGWGLEIAGFLVVTDGGPILVECGPHSNLDKLIAGIERYGYKWTDIQHLLLTHIHLDHAGAAWCFAENGAQVYVHPKGYKHMHDPTKLLKSAKMIYGELMDAMWGDLKAIPEEQLHIIEDGDELEIYGQVFKAIHSPGHAVHHIAWQMDSVLFAGDLAGICVDGGPIMPPCPPPDINIEHWISSIDKVLDINVIDTYYITHMGKITNCLEHMDQLKKTLQAFADFVLPYYQNQTPVEEVLPKFTAFTKQMILDNGFSKEDADNYERSNPALMSVSGLMRYWHKKFNPSKPK